MPGPRQFATVEASESWCLRRLIGKQLLGKSDITYVVLSQFRRIGIVSFPNTIKLLMLLGGKKAMIEREKFARVLPQHERRSFYV